MSNEFCEEILALASSLSLTPVKVRGVSQCSFQVTINGTEMVLWIGYYPGFAGKGKESYKWQGSLSTKAKAVRWGLTDEGVEVFLKAALFVDAVPIARKGKDLKALRG